MLFLDDLPNVFQQIDKPDCIFSTWQKMIFV